MAGFKEWVGESPDWYSFAWKTGMTYAAMMQILHDENRGLNLAPGRVPHTMLYAFVRGEIVGRLSVRHTLNEHLRRRGGHIGYAVAPRFRRRGYATEIVRQGLEYCWGLGLSEVMVTCSDTNVPSYRVIEHFGGQLEDRIWDDVDHEWIRRYWIRRARA